MTLLIDAFLDAVDEETDTISPNCHTLSPSSSLQLTHNKELKDGGGGGHKLLAAHLYFWWVLENMNA